MPIDIIAAGAKAALSLLFSEVTKTASSELRKKITANQVNARIKNISERLSSVNKITTLLDPERPISIEQIYVSPNLQYGHEGRKFSPQKLDDISSTDNIVIEATAGHGKSMLLRYLTIKECILQKRLPIFLELRKMRGTKLPDFIELELDALGFPSPPEIFKIMAESGNTIVLLDGFDEVRDEEKSQTIVAIERLAKKYPNLRLVITTRPDSGLRGIPGFLFVTISDLKSPDREKIITKISTPKQADSLLKALKKNRQVDSLLKTPLLVTLLCVTYRTEPKLPETLHEFYEMIFSALLHRHDMLKPGFERPRASKLGNYKFRLVFESLCYLSFVSESLRLQHANACQLSEQALKIQGINPSFCEDFVNDCVKITCLLVKDGVDEYQFAHKSIQEYFTARYICQLPESTKRKFFQNVSKSKLNNIKWVGPFLFLREIDTYSYGVYFEIPLLESLLQVKFTEWDNEAIMPTVDIARSLIPELTNLSINSSEPTAYMTEYGMSLTTALHSEIITDLFNVEYYLENGDGVLEILNSLKKSDKIKSNENNYSIRLIDLLDRLNLWGNFLKSEAMKNSMKFLEDRLRFWKSIEERKILVEASIIIPD